MTSSLSHAPFEGSGIEDGSSDSEFVPRHQVGFPVPSATLNCEQLRFYAFASWCLTFHFMEFFFKDMAPLGTSNMSHISFRKSSLYAWVRHTCPALCNPSRTMQFSLTGVDRCNSHLEVLIASLIPSLFARQSRSLILTVHMGFRLKTIASCLDCSAERIRPKFDTNIRRFKFAW